MCLVNIHRWPKLAVLMYDYRTTHHSMPIGPHGLMDERVIPSNLVGLRAYTVSSAEPRLETRKYAENNWPPSKYEMDSGIKPLALPICPHQYDY